MKNFLLIFLISGIISCSKETVLPPVTQLPQTPVVPGNPIVLYSTASYEVTVTLNWTSPQFSVPQYAHVTALIGMIHSVDTSLWMPGALSTQGLRNVAEVGDNYYMNRELDAIISKGKSLSKFMYPAFPVTGRMDTVMNFNSSFPMVSFASMVAPSPDWFMGIHNVNLFENNNWVSAKTVDLLLYDAGTEDGDVFGYDNPETMPHQPIGLLTTSNASVLANGNASLAPIGTIKFTKR